MFSTKHMPLSWRICSTFSLFFVLSLVSKLSYGIISTVLKSSLCWSYGCWGIPSVFVCLYSTFLPWVCFGWVLNSRWTLGRGFLDQVLSLWGLFHMDLSPKKAPFLSHERRGEGRIHGKTNTWLLISFSETPRHVMRFWSLSRNAFLGLGPRWCRALSCLDPLWVEDW